MLTLCPQIKFKVSESGIKWQKSMVPISMEGTEKIWLNSLCVMSNFKVFATKQWPNTTHAYPYDSNMYKKSKHMHHEH